MLARILLVPPMIAMDLRDAGREGSTRYHDSDMMMMIATVSPVAHEKNELMAFILGLIAS